MNGQKQVVGKRFEIDTEGFRIQMSSMKPWRIVQEIISNSFDEDSVKNISVEIEQIGTKQIQVTIIDDGVGFEDINDIYTMYKYSKKRKKSDKRGRFNMGEKEFFVLAETGFVKTKNQMVEFKNDTRTTSQIDHPTGTIVQGVFKWTGTDFQETLLKLHKLIVPDDKNLTINNTTVQKKHLLKKITFALPTLIEDEDTLQFRRVTKTCEIELYQTNKNERPYLYELGIPVHKLLHSIEWHINVLQKIPLPTGRDMVSEAYLKDLYAGILNNATDLINEENSGSKWVGVAMSESTPEAAKVVLKNQFGTTDIYIPSQADYHANEHVLETGGKLLTPGFMDGETRKHLKDLKILKISTDDFASDSSKRCNIIEPNVEMKLYERVTKMIAKEVLGKDIDVAFVDSDSTHGAWYGHNTLTFNVGTLGKSFFTQFSPYSVGLIIHELSHDKRHDEGENVPHFTREFISELERIGGIVGSKGIQYYVDKCREPMKQENKS